MSWLVWLLVLSSKSIQFGNVNTLFGSYCILFVDMLNLLSNLIIVIWFNVLCIFLLRHNWSNRLLFFVRLTSGKNFCDVLNNVSDKHLTQELSRTYLCFHLDHLLSAIAPLVLFTSALLTHLSVRFTSTRCPCLAVRHNLATMSFLPANPMLNA